jgi:phosphoglycolate phosphatase
LFQDLFAVVIGGEDVSNHKPDPEGLIKAMAILDTTPEQCFYIGDSRIDADTAERAQVEFIAVLSGVTKKEEFRYAKTHSVLNNLYELI